MLKILIPVLFILAIAKIYYDMLQAKKVDKDKEI